MSTKIQTNEEYYNSFLVGLSPTIKSHYNKDQLKSYFDMVQSSHDDVRSKLDSIRLEVLDQEIDESEGISLLKNDILDCARKIPDFFRQYKMKPADLFTADIKTIKSNLSKWLKTIDKYSDEAMYAKSIDTDLASIKKNPRISYVIDTSPGGFLKLGHYGCDNGTCLSDTGSNKRHKFNLGVSKDSFVFRICVGPTITDSSDIRAFGFYAKDHIAIMNIYNNTKLYGFNRADVVKFIAKAIFGHKKFDTNECTLSLSSGTIYHNPGSDIVAFTGNFKESMKSFNHVAKVFGS